MWTPLNAPLRELKIVNLATIRRKDALVVNKTVSLMY